MTEVAHDNEWLEVRVEADAESVDAVAELLSRYAHNQGVVIQEPYRQDPDGDNLEIDPQRRVRVSAYLALDERLDAALRGIDEGLWYLRRLGTVGELEHERLHEEDWANAWKAHFPVTRIGRHFVIRPTWRTYTPTSGDIVIDLDPGMAFGTGLHPTTELCLRWLEDIPLSGVTMLDAGAGSGILSIAAVKLGAARIDAVEIDPVAASALRANVELNHSSDRVHVLNSDISHAPLAETGYDLVVANIISRILIESVNAISGACRQGATIVLSGVIAAHEADVLKAYGEAGVDILDRRVGGDWISLLGRRAPN